jgi:exodeoxyribonuclease VII small subunit
VSSKDGNTQPGAPAEPSFEDSVRRLGEIVDRLETGELPLEESLRLFEEGVRLARASQSRLDAAERRVQELLGIDEDGNPVVREVDPE